MATTRKARKAAPADDSPQRELAPAPVAPAANDEARAAIATINAQLSEFDKVEAGLADLERKYKGVAYDCTTKKGMDDACAARLDIRKPRFAVESARKAAKAPVLKLGRDIDARAATITARLLAIEDPIDAQVKVQERKEAERKADLERRIAEIEATPKQCIGKTAVQLQEVLEGLDTLPLADFQEYRERAAKAQFDAQQAVRVLHQQAIQSEELAALRAKQEVEENRKKLLQQRVDAIADPLHLPYRSSERVQQAISRLEALAIGEDFQEFAPAAREKKTLVLAQLGAMLEKKLAAEKEAAEALYAPETAAAPGPAPAPLPEGLAGASQDVQGEAKPATIGRTLQGDFDRVFGSAPAPAAAPRGADEDPFTAPRSILSYETVKTGPDSGFFASPEAAAAIRDAIRPTDGEMLAVLADHYEVDAATAAAWLRTFDAAAALAQLALPL